MRCVVAAMLFFVGGCVASPPVGPDARSQERALEVVWEGVLAMEVASRPAIVWMGTCTPNRIGVTIDQPICWGETTTPAHGVELMWSESKISDTKFVNGLYAWRVYLMTGAFKSYDHDDLVTIAMSEQSLIDAGL